MDDEAKAIETHRKDINETTSVAHSSSSVRQKKAQQADSTETIHRTGKYVRGTDELREKANGWRKSSDWSTSRALQHQLNVGGSDEGTKEVR